MSAARRHGGNRAPARGIALLGALMLVVIVVGIAATVGVRSIHDISISARLAEAASAGAVFADLERQSQAALVADARRGAADTSEEAWALTEVVSTAAGAQGTGRMRDLQGRFNLNSLAFDLAGGGGFNDGEGGPLPPGMSADGAGDGEAVFADPALTATSAEPAAADDELAAMLAAVAAENPPPAESAEPEVAAPETPEVDPGMQALAMIPAVAAAMAATPSASGTAAPAGAAGTALTLTPQQIAIGRFALLLRALDIDAALLPALLDWIDTDSDPRFPNGAEDDYYTELPDPYRTANQPLSDVSELALIRGFDDEVREKLAPYVTVLPGQTPININTADATVLVSLAPAMDESAAQMVINARKTQPFESVEQFMNLPVLFGRPLVASGLTTASTFFQLDMSAESGRSITQARATLGRRDQLRTTLLQRSLGYLDE